MRRAHGSQADAAATAAAGAEMAEAAVHAGAGPAEGAAQRRVLRRDSMVHEVVVAQRAEDAAKPSDAPACAFRPLAAWEAHVLDVAQPEPVLAAYALVGVVPFRILQRELAGPSGASVQAVEFDAAIA